MQANSGDNDTTCDGQDTAMSSLATIHKLLDNFMDVTRQHTTTSRRNSHHNNNNSQPYAQQSPGPGQANEANSIRPDTYHGDGSKLPGTNTSTMMQRQTKRFSQLLRKSLVVMGNPIRSEEIFDSLHVPRSSSIIAVPDEINSNGGLKGDMANPPPNHARASRRQTLICIDHSRETRVRASIVQAYKTAGLLPVMVNNQEEANDVKAGMYHLGEPSEHEEDAPILQILRRGTLRLKPIVYDPNDDSDDDDDGGNDSDDEMNCQHREARNGLHLPEETKNTLVSASVGPIIRSSMKGTKDAFTSAIQTVQSSVRDSISSIISNRSSARQSLLFPSFSRRPSESRQQV